MRIVGYSKALYATWLYLEPLHLLLDVGEGVNTWLEGRLLALRDIFISHGHTDHFTGLQNVLVTRLRPHLREAGLPTLRVCYPAGETEIERYLAYLIEAHAGKAPGLVQLQPLRPGQCVALSANGRVACQSFAVVHRQTTISFGYRLFERRWVLKPEFVSTSQSDINLLVTQHGRSHVAQEIERNLVCYSGDTVGIDPAPAAQADVLIHEATFIDDEAEHGHSTLAGAVATWRASGARHLVLMHLSSRYQRAAVTRALQIHVPDPEERQRVSVILPGRLFDEEVAAGGF